MPDDPTTIIPPAGDPAPAPAPPPPPAPRLAGPVTCEFCECKLAPDGGVMQMSDKARGYVRQGEKLASVNADLEACQTDLRNATARVQQLEAGQQPTGGRTVLDLRRKAN